MKKERWNSFKRKFYMTVTVIAFLCICSALYYRTQEMKKDEARYIQKLEKVEKKYQDEENRTQEIEEHRAYVQTKKYAEEVARDKFGMVYADEIIFTPKK